MRPAERPRRRPQGRSSVAGSAPGGGFEVKAGATVTAADFRGLRKLREATGKQFTGGVVLYDGEMSLGFGEAMHAVPIRALWESA